MSETARILAQAILSGGGGGRRTHVVHALAVRPFYYKGGYSCFSCLTVVVRPRVFERTEHRFPTGPITDSHSFLVGGCVHRTRQRPRYPRDTDLDQSTK